MPKLLSAVDVDRYKRDGFLYFDSEIPDSELQKIRDSLFALHNNNVGFTEGALFDAISPEEEGAPRRFPQILHPSAFAPLLLETEFFRTAQAISRQLLGDDIRFKGDISLLKPAHIGAATPWHQDEAFHDPRFEYSELSFWLALQPTDATNSCMVYLPGSHLGPVQPHGFPNNDPRIHALECTAAIDTSKAVACHIPTGGCVIHNQRTLHYAGPNTSDRPRLAYVIGFDVVPTPATEAREFPWREAQKTARAEREKSWRRRGGLLVHLWRQRSRMRITSVRHMVFDIRRAVSAVLRAR